MLTTFTLCPPVFDFYVGACFPHFLRILRGSKLKKLYLDSTSTTVGNFHCSISEPLGKRYTMVPPLMVDTVDDPRLLEALAYNTSLTYLSIAANRASPGVDVE